MSTSTRFHYVKCLGDNTWLAKPANAGVFKKDIRQAAALTIDEAAILGWAATDPVYKLVPIEEVYPYNKRRELKDAIDKAREALIGDSNDDEHDALVSLMEALDQTIPERDGPEYSIRMPTKGDFIRFLQSLPFPDDYTINVSLDQQDIHFVKRVDASQAPMQGSRELLLNFQPDL